MSQGFSQLQMALKCGRHPPLRQQTGLGQLAQVAELEFRATPFAPHVPPTARIPYLVPKGVEQPARPLWGLELTEVVPGLGMYLVFCVWCKWCRCPSLSSPWLRLSSWHCQSCSCCVFLSQPVSFSPPLQIEVVNTFKSGASFQGALRRQSSVTSQSQDVANLSSPSRVSLSNALSSPTSLPSAAAGRECDSLPPPPAPGPASGQGLGCERTWGVAHPCQA